MVTKTCENVTVPFYDMRKKLAVLTLAKTSGNVAKEMGKIGK